MIRLSALDGGARASRRQLLRMGFFGATTLAVAELGVAVAPFLRVTRSATFGGKFTLPWAKSEILERFAATGDEPILFAQEKFFVLHPPGGLVAAYRKCTHLGCAVPFSKHEDRFHCPCHQSVYDKRTALLISGPAPRGLDLFHVSEEGEMLIVDTNPFDLLVRDDNRWHPEHVEVRG